MRVLFALTASLLLAAPAGAASKPRCDPDGAKTFAGSGEVRVYERAGSVVACHFGSGRKLVLGRSAADLSDAYGVGTVQVAGRYVAWVERRSDDNKATGESPDRLHFADARDARRIDFGGVGCPEVALGSGGSGGLTVQSVAVSEDGGLAWGCYGGPEDDSTAEIRKFDRTGPALLDARPRGSTRADETPAADSVSAVATDLSTVTARVYWKTGQGARSAGLRGEGDGVERLKSAAGHRRCRPARAVTVAGSGQVRVYERRGAIVACHLRSGRRTRLGLAGRAALRRDKHGASIVKVAGRYVAVALRREPLSAGDHSVDRLHLVDARRGRRIDVGPVGCGAPDANFAGVLVRGVQVTSRGALAWGCSGGSDLEIHKHDRGGAAVLDSRPADDSGTDDLEFDSAAISESPFGPAAGRVYWETGEGARSAELR